jgi:hypothetical protein
MLLDEAEEPMDFSRGSERLQEYTERRMEASSGPVPEEKLGRDPFAAAQKQLGDSNAGGLDLSVLDRLSQKVIRWANFIFLNCTRTLSVIGYFSKAVWPKLYFQCNQKWSLFLQQT